jgi:hypothetical protein
MNNKINPDTILKLWLNFEKADKKVVSDRLMVMGVGMERGL